MTRAEVREHIFKLIFRIEFNDPEDMPEQLKDYFEDPYKADLDSDTPEEDEKVCLFSEKNEEYITVKYNAIYGMLSVLDECINDASKGWDTTRMGKVELAILRLAVYEMKYDDNIPVGVAIDQAVELAKKYGQDESASFVNGILATVAKTVADKAGDVAKNSSDKD